MNTSSCDMFKNKIAYDPEEGSTSKQIDFD